MIFVLKFGAWRMSVFATDRRYSDNGIYIISFVIACGLTREAISKDGFKNLAICPSASLSRTNIGVGVFLSTLESDRSSNASMSSIMTRSTFNTCV
jgi:hypothetical protein